MMTIASTKPLRAKKSMRRSPATDAAASLRIYLRRRAAGRRAAEAVRYVVVEEPTDDRPGWRYGIGCNPGDSDAVLIRQPKSPWCPWLGRDQAVAGDPALQALFATWDAESDDRQREARWRNLARQARTQQGAERLLWSLRRKGERLLSAAQPKEGAAGGRLAGLFAPNSNGQAGSGAVLIRRPAS
jgi:hypothetical protein